MSSECLHLRGYLCIFVICSLTIRENSERAILRMGFRIVLLTLAQRNEEQYGRKNKSTVDQV